MTELDLCPVCAVPFKAGDTCATDIELGACHAQCLDGSPVVDLDTGDPSDGPIATYAYEPHSPALAAPEPVMQQRRYKHINPGAVWGEWGERVEYLDADPDYISESRPLYATQVAACDPDGCKAHIEAFMARATAAEARVAELERERDRWKFRGDNHWETLKSIREMARVGECDRIIQWVNDAGSGYTDSADATLASMQARATAAEAQAAKMREALAEAKKALEYSSHCLDGVVALDDEDQAPDGGCLACQACIKINKRAIAKIDALASPAQEPQE